MRLIHPMAKHKKDEPKDSVSFRIKKSTMSVMGEVAADKRWSESQTADELLDWAVRQLRLAGSFDALVKTNIASVRGGRKAS